MQIKDFIDAAALALTDLFPLSQSGNTRKTTLQNLKNLLLGTGTLNTTSQQVIGAINENTASLSDVTLNRGYLTTKMVESTTDLNTLISNGKYKISNSTINTPDESTSNTWLIEVISSSGSYVFQIARCIYSSIGNTGKTYIRNSTNSNWSSWKQVATTNMEAWNTAVLQNGWTAYVNGFQYFKHHGIVYLGVSLTVGTITPGTTITTLPVGYRPKSTIVLRMTNTLNGDIDSLTIQSNGVVVVQASATFTAGTFVLGEISYRGDN